jgi:hypothetical protein
MKYCQKICCKSWETEERVGSFWGLPPFHSDNRSEYSSEPSLLVEYDDGLTARNQAHVALATRVTGYCVKDYQGLVCKDWNRVSCE